LNPGCGRGLPSHPLGRPGRRLSGHDRGLCHHGSHGPCPSEARTRILRVGNRDFVRKRGSNRDAEFVGGDASVVCVANKHSLRLLKLLFCFFFLQQAYERRRKSIGRDQTFHKGRDADGIFHLLRSNDHIVELRLGKSQSNECVRNYLEDTREIQKRFHFSLEIFGCASL